MAMTETGGTAREAYNPAFGTRKAVDDDVLTCNHSRNLLLMLWSKNTYIFLISDDDLCNVIN